MTDPTDRYLSFGPYYHRSWTKDPTDKWQRAARAKADILWEDHPMNDDKWLGIGDYRPDMMQYPEPDRAPEGAAIALVLFWIAGLVIGIVVGAVFF